MRLARNILFSCLSLLFFLFLLGCAQQPPIQKINSLPKAVIVPPKADFQANITEGQTPLNIKFIANCSGDITFWRWDFGDGEFAIVPSPQHLYSSEGLYSVTLKVEGPGGGDTKIKPGYIKVTNDVINWKLAKNYIGQNKIVEGVVLNTFYATNVKGKPTFFNFNIPYSGYFSCLLWDTDRVKFIKQFSAAPDAYFLQKFVRVKGLIEEYPKGSNVPEIILKEPSQIEIIEK
jgi:hypothetical protein